MNEDTLYQFVKNNSKATKLLKETLVLFKGNNNLDLKKKLDERQTVKFMDWVEEHSGELKKALVFGRDFIDKANNQAIKKKELDEIKELKKSK